MTSNSRDVAVVGMACVFPDAPNLARYWHNIANGIDAIRELPHDRWPGSRNLELPPDHHAHIGCRRGGFIPTPFHFDALRYKVMPSVAGRGDADQFILLAVIDDALKDAGIGEDHPARSRTDVIVGRGGYMSDKVMEIFLRADLIDRLRRYIGRQFPMLGPSDLDAFVADMHASLPERDIDALVTAIPNLVASRTANRLDLQGSAYIVDAACASSLISVEQAVRRLREDLCDLALACGINFTQVPSFWYMFDKIMAVSPSGGIRPFDQSADGLLIGEGAGAVALKRLEDARRDGDRVYAIIKGAGSAGDGADTAILAPSSRGQVQALENAYLDAGVDPDTIGYLEAHGTGTPPGDAAELQTIKSVFGRRKSRYATRVMGSVKSMIGHTMPAAGIASFIKTTLSLSNRILPPSLHCDSPHPELADAPFYVNTAPRAWVHAPGGSPRRAGINAFGFGGINSHVILEEVVTGKAAGVSVPGSAIEPSVAESEPALARPPCSNLERPSELLVFCGPTPRALAERVRRVVHFVTEDQQPFTLEDLAYTLANGVDLEASCKLAVVVDGLEDLTAKLEPLAAQLDRGQVASSETDGVFFGEVVSRPPGSLAAFFPGLAFPGLIGNYPDHLMTLCAHHPRLRDVFDLVDARDSHPDDPLPTSFLLQPPAHLSEEERKRLRERFAIVAPLVSVTASDEPVHPEERLLSAMGMLASNWAGWRLLEPLGIPVGMLCGLSLGDVSALCASGMVDFDDVVPRMLKYLDLDSYQKLRFSDTGRWAFIGTTEERLATLLEGIKNIHIAVYQSKETLIVGGPEKEINDLVRVAREQEILAQALPFPPVHTPLVGKDKRRFLAMEGKTPKLRKPQITVYSTITASPIPNDLKKLRSALASNFTHAVRFWNTVERMYEDGARVFIQVGTGTLAANIRGSLDRKDVICVALDVDYRDPITQLNRLCGTLFAAGVPMNLTGLFEARQPRELPLDAPRDPAEKSKGTVPLVLYYPPLHVQGSSPASTQPSTSKVETDGQVRSAAGSPLVGRVVHFEPGRKIVHVRRFDLNEDLFLEDHAFIGDHHPRPLRKRFPVVPLTMTLEMLAETGACLAPGRLLLGFEKVHARKWIALDDIDVLDVRVEAEVVSTEEDLVEIQATVLVDDDVSASTTVRFGTRYRQTLDLGFTELTNPHALPMTAERLYLERHTFHGPRFQCVSALETRGDQGIMGELEVLGPDTLFRNTDHPHLMFDPVALDGTGQLLASIFFDRGVDMLPVSIETIEFYRTPPPPGTRVPARAEITDFNFDERRIVGNMEVQDGQGRVWFRVAAWQDILFRYGKPLLLFRRMPTQRAVSQELAVPDRQDDAIAMVLPRSLLRDAAPDRFARFALDGTEWEEFVQLEGGLRKMREWLMGRIVAKDTARTWLARRTGEAMLHPILVNVANDPNGRPVLELPDGHGTAPFVSITHKDRIAAAAVSSSPVGIDVEILNADNDLRLDDFATATEVRRIAEIGGDGDPEWVMRVWCAKEAASKALATGLGGRPKAFVVDRVESDGTMVVRHGQPPQEIHVATWCSNGNVFALASLCAELAARS